MTTASTPPRRSPPAAEPGLVLVVDDSELIRDLLRGHLREQGHEVVVAADGLEAITRLGTRPFDLILTDLEMPRLNGFQLLEHLKGEPKYRDIPVIVISGHGELDGIAHCIKRGAEDYLPKPFNRTILKARVDACLEKKRLRDRNECQRKRLDELLHSILPGPIVQELTQTDAVRPRLHQEVAVLFADVVGFTTYCDRLQGQPEVVVRHLKHFFESSEEIASRLQRPEDQDHRRRLHGRRRPARRGREPGARLRPLRPGPDRDGPVDAPTSTATRWAGTSASGSTSAPSSPASWAGSSRSTTSGATR